MYGAPDRASWLGDVARALESEAEVEVMDDGVALRRLLEEAPDSYSVLVAEGGPIEAINLAAAVVRDGCAHQTVLLCGETSGSLRSRAVQAGIDRVLSEREAEVAVRATTPKAEETDRDGPALDGHRTLPPTSADEKDHGEGDLDDAPPAFPMPGVPNPVVVRDAEASAPILCVVSGRGGVGKSALAATLATTAASWGMRTCLLDLDLGFGNLYGYFGLDGPADITPLAEGVDGERVEKQLMKAAPGVDILGPCAVPEYGETVSPKTQEILRELCRSHDLVVVDTSTTWGEAVAQALQWADRVLICADERAGAIGSLSRAAALAVRLGVARTRIVRVMNRCDPRHRDEGFLARADLGLETARTLRIQEGGIEIPELLSAGHGEEIPVLENGFSSSCAHGLAQLLSELGCLPDCEESRRARDGKGSRSTGVLAFLKGAV